LENSLKNVKLLLLVVLSLLVSGCCNKELTLPAEGKYLIYREVIDSPAPESLSEVAYFVRAVRDDGAAVEVSGTPENLTCVVLGSSNQSAASARAAMRETSLLFKQKKSSYSGPDLPTDSITYGVEGNTRTWEGNIHSSTEAGLQTDEFQEYRDFAYAFIGVRLYISDATNLIILGRTSTILQSNYDLLPLVGDFWDPDKAIGVLESIMPRMVKKSKRK
jgi:hypothetical protein